MKRKLAAGARAHVNGSSKGRPTQDLHAFAFADADCAKPRGQILFEREFDHTRRVANRDARELGRRSVGRASRAKRRNIKGKESGLGHRNLLKVTFN